MHFAAIATVALSALAAAAPADLEAREKGCVRGVHVIGLGGQGTTQGDLGYLTTLVNNITAAIPHSNSAQIGYPVGALGPVAIGYAIPKLREHIAGYSARCPNTKMVIASYSVGGAADMDVFCGAPSNGTGALVGTFRKNILANIVYGDLTFVSGKKYNQGTCTSGKGVVPRLKPGACHPYGMKTQSFCDFNDPNCCGNGQGDISVHFSYPGKYDLIATQWVKNRWLKYQKRKHSRAN